MNRSLFALAFALLSSATEASTFKYVLESYDPCEFKYIFVANDNSYIEVVLPDTGLVVDAVVGASLIGKHHGKLTTVSSQEIVITEIMPNSSGGYFESPLRITFGKSGNITSCSRSQPSAAGTPQSGAP